MRSDPDRALLELYLPAHAPRAENSTEFKEIRGYLEARQETVKNAEYPDVARRLIQRLPESPSEVMGQLNNQQIRQS